MRAIERLDYSDFLRFIGVSPCQRRRSVYRTIRKSLSGGARVFWDSHPKMLDKGVIYQGGWEKYFYQLSFIIRQARPLMLKRLFDCRNIEEQAYVWNTGWNNAEWRGFIRILSSRLIWKYFLRDPGFYRFVPPLFSIPDYSLEKFAFVFENILVRKSPYANLLFWGKYDPKGALPIYLRKENYLTIQSRLASIRIVTQSLGDYLEKGAKRFNKYSLSDFSSYTGWEDYKRIWKGIIRTAKNEAVICERQYLVKRNIPKEISGFVSRDSDLELKLQRTDNSIFFSFIVARLNRKSNV
jgi:S-adenosylmethionine-diacylglycerol 3-amino-3-carboxypropyl transferase